MRRRSKTKRVRKQKDRPPGCPTSVKSCCSKITFPRVWAPSPENRDLRQLLWHRHRLVQMRTRIMNQLQALAMNEARAGRKDCGANRDDSQLEKIPLAPWASRRRQDLLELLDRMNPTIAELTAAVEQEAKKRPEVLRLMTHPGVGPITALAFVDDHHDSERFPCGKQVGSYVGLIPCEDSSAGRQRLGHISKQATRCCASVGGSSASSGALRSGLAASVPTPGDAARTSNRQGGDGAQSSRSLVLDVAQWLGVFAVRRVRFARGTARYRTWCEVAPST